MMGKTRQMGYFYLSWYDELAMTGQHGKVTLPAHNSASRGLCNRKYPLGHAYTMTSLR